MKNETRTCRCAATHSEHGLLLARIDERVGTLVRDSGDQETRIRRLERWRNMLVGAMTATTAGIAKVLHLAN
jgi:hypothetical protein